MTYQVLARKYRPRQFGELVGQEHVARSLQHAIERERVAHAYLFSGPRGVGKTSVARIFAQALNCSDNSQFEPCGKCSNCREIAQGSSLAVWEIDGASHNSVDNVRELIETFRTALPSHIKQRVYIIDEVHMLSVPAFNAFLKSLEEPPPDLVIIMATTEAHKIPDTVVSRCQRYDFRLLSSIVVTGHLQKLLQQESVACDSGTLSLVTRLSEGSLRDALSLLDRIVSFCGREITLSEASSVLGVVNKSELFELTRCILERDVKGVLTILHALGSGGGDTSIIIREFVSHWRELFLSSFLEPKLMAMHSISPDDIEELKSQTRGIDSFDIKELNDLAREESDRALRSFHPWYAFEALVVRMATRERAADLRSLFESVSTGSRSVDSRSSTSSSRAVSSASASKKSMPRSASSVSGSVAPTAGDLDWRKCVEFVKRYPGTRLLSEQLRRVEVEKFVPGQLVLRGDKLAKNYLGRAENKSKLAKCLQEFTNIADWDIQLLDGAVQSSAENKSIEGKERKAQQDKKNELRVKIENSPEMQNIKAVFPGSQLKRIANGE